MFSFICTVTDYSKNRTNDSELCLIKSSQYGYLNY